MSLAGKVAIVTGAAQGLGKAFCSVLLDNGAKVFMTDINESNGLTTLKDFEIKHGVNVVVFKKCDVSSKSDMEGDDFMFFKKFYGRHHDMLDKYDVFKSAKETWGNIDIVCNNAGIGAEKEPAWEKTVDINLKGVIRGTNLGMEYLRKDKGGRGGVIVNISSMAGLNPNPFGPIYCATKHAIIGFTRSWALNPETSQNGVRLNMLCPAFVDTNLVSSLSEETCLNVDKAKMFVQQVGIMTPEYVAEGFLELVSDENNTGALLKMAKSFGKVYHKFERA